MSSLVQLTYHRKLPRRMKALVDLIFLMIGVAFSPRLIIPQVSCSPQVFTHHVFGCDSQFRSTGDGRGHHHRVW